MSEENKEQEIGGLLGTALSLKKWLGKKSGVEIGVIGEDGKYTKSFDIPNIEESYAENQTVDYSKSEILSVTSWSFPNTSGAFDTIFHVTATNLQDKKCVKSILAENGEVVNVVDFNFNMSVIILESKSSNKPIPTYFNAGKNLNLC